MNVLEAIERMNELDRKMTAIRRIDAHIGRDRDFVSELRVLSEIYEGLAKERNQIKDRLEKTNLANVRGSKE